MWSLLLFAIFIIWGRIIFLKTDDNYYILYSYIGICLLLSTYIVLFLDGSATELLLFLPELYTILITTVVGGVLIYFYWSLKFYLHESVSIESISCAHIFFLGYFFARLPSFPVSNEDWLNYQCKKTSYFGDICTGICFFFLYAYLLYAIFANFSLYHIYLYPHLPIFWFIIGLTWSKFFFQYSLGNYVLKKYILLYPIFNHFTTLPFYRYDLRSYSNFVPFYFAAYNIRTYSEPVFYLTFLQHWRLVRYPAFSSKMHFKHPISDLYTSFGITKYCLNL